MKGTIDVQIKHKDGSIETRHEHNVVFDLQALATKYFYSRPYGSMTGALAHKYITSSTYDIFSLSTLELDLTKPSVAIPALTSTTGSSSVWYTAPITSTISDKNRISTATWTAGEAITLKSIFFPYDHLFFARDKQGTGTTSSSLVYKYSRCMLCDDGLFFDKDCNKRFTKSFDGFKFTNTYLNGFSNTYAAEVDSFNGSVETAFVPYKLHDPTERFLFDTVSGESHYRSYYPYYSTGELQIKDAATNTVKRSFNLSQFANSTFTTTSYRALVRVVNTGSKNFLLEPVSTAEGIRVWEIPDTATSETIQPSGMILANKGVYMYYYYHDCLSVADNVLMYRKSNNSSYITCARINDDLSIDIVPGANVAGIPADYSPNDSYNNALWPYMNTGSPHLYRSSNGYMFDNSGTYVCRFFNSTAANFSTPITLAEGDVLTISYKIEVA